MVPSSMPDDETPPVRKLVLKPKEIVPTDTPARLGDGTAISVRLIHRHNEIAEQRSEARGAAHAPPGAIPDTGTAAEASPFKRKDIDLTDAPSKAGDGTEISAGLILKANRLAQARHEPELIAMPPHRRSRCMRDDIILESVGVALLGSLVFAIPNSIQVLLLGLCLMGIYSGVLAWIMFGVMDAY